MSQTQASPFDDRATVAPGRRLNGALLARRMHGYLGMLIAPSVLFFAATGGVQLFNLHEAHGAYKPPPVLVALSAVHKDQALPRPKPAAAEADEPDHDHDHGHDHGGAEAGPKLATWFLKWVFLAVSVGLVVSTGLGLWMAFQDRRRRTLNAVLLAIGVIAPLLLALA